MIGYLYIDNNIIGEADFKVIDETMGVIGGDFIAYAHYENYRSQIQNRYDVQGIANVDDLNFSVITENGLKLEPEGGIGIIDSRMFEGMYVEVAGLDRAIIEAVTMQH
jgi:hypothetical protein